jgi:hypothetical protein
MKKPRIEDYDPNAVPKLGTPMDDMPRIEKPKGERGLDQDSEAVAPFARPRGGMTPDRPIGGTGDRPPARPLARVAFEIYLDQHAALKQFSIEELTRGEKGSMSQMVREAIDLYIAKRREQQGS